MKNKLIWKSEKEQLKELEKEKETRDREKYGRDGYVLSAEGEFIYKGVSYLIKVLRYYNFDDGFTNMSDRISDYHAVVEYPDETRMMVDLVSGIEDVYDFLYHDTNHSFNDKQTIEEQIELCHKWAKEDIDSLFSGEISDKLDKSIKKLQELKSEFKKLVKGEESELRFEQTCGACPEQYDVWLEDKQVAYIRLRWGYLDCSMPDVDGKIIYEYNFNDRLKGCFDDEAEREKYLAIIKKKIIEKIKGEK